MIQKLTDFLTKSLPFMLKYSSIRTAARPLCRRQIKGRGIAQMKILLQLGIIFLIAMFGNFLSELLDIGIPGNVMAMLLMLGLLLSGLLKASKIKDASDFLLKNMVVFFIPLTVNLIGVYDLIKSYVPTILVISVVTTVSTFYVTYLTVCLVSRLQKASGRKRA